MGQVSRKLRNEESVSLLFRLLRVRPARLLRMCRETITQEYPRDTIPAYPGRRSVLEDSQYQCGIFGRQYDWWRHFVFTPDSDIVLVCEELSVGM